MICERKKITDDLLIGSQRPTWNTLKSSFVMLGLCLALMLGLAFSASDSALVLHVAFLVLITATLFLLLSWYLNISAKKYVFSLICAPCLHMVVHGFLSVASISCLLL